MKKKLKIFFCCLLCLAVMTGGLLSCAPAPPPVAPAAPAKPAAPVAPTPAPAAPAPAEKVILKMGVTSATSGSFIGPAAFARVVTKYAPGIEIVALESGATYDNLFRIREGIFDMGAFYYDAAAEAYLGKGMFDGEPFKEVRVLMQRTAKTVYNHIYVRKDSGIKSFSDFVGTGKKLCPGIPGSGTERFIRRAVEALGADVDIWPASYSDATKALREGRIEGIVKATTGPEIYDSSMVEVNLTTPLTIVGFSEEEIDKIRVSWAQYGFNYYPKGTNKVDPEAGDYYTFSPFSTYYGSTRIPEEIVYRIIKAASEHTDDLLAADPTSAWEHPVADLIKFIEGAGFKAGKAALLHAGTVRYAKEKGIEVPDFLIPPEYKK